MYGSFSEEALEQFAQLAAQTQAANFSEGATYDFTRCVRPNGTAYGTGGECRKGTEEELDLKNVRKKITKLKKSIKEAEGAEAYQTRTGDHAYAKHWRDKAQRDREALAALQEQLPAGKTPQQKPLTPVASKPKPLSQGEEKILVNYMTGGSMETGSMLNTNWKLRGLTKDPLTDEEKGQVKLMDEALSKLPRNTRGVTMYRGMDLDPETAAGLLRKVQQAKILNDEGFGSFSADRDQADMFANQAGGVPVIIVSRSKEFRNASRYAPEEFQDQQEHILPRNTPLRVEKVVKSPEGTVFIHTNP